MKKIQSKMKELEWSQHYSLIFHTLKGSLVVNSKVSDGILPKFKLIRAFMIGLVICKNEEDPSKKEGTRVVTTFLLLMKFDYDWPAGFRDIHV